VRSPTSTPSNQQGDFQMKEKWTRIEPLSAEIEAGMEEWFANKRGVGFCCLCGEVILSADDFIPLSNTHNCAEGLASERRDQRGQQPRCNEDD
jgi:hypothetical protein